LNLYKFSHASLLLPYRHTNDTSIATALPPTAVQDFLWALPTRIPFQLNMPGLDLPVYDFQNPDRPWEFESLWARRAGIEQQRLAEPFNFQLMRMTKDTEVWLFFLKERSAVFRQLPACIQNMTNSDAAAGQFDHGLGRKSALFIIVNVAGDGGDRSDLLQLFDHGLIANVSGVENVIDPFKMSSNRRIEYAMGIGDHSDSHDAPLTHGAATGWTPSDS
jgi:hypothetical protein